MGANPQHLNGSRSRVPCCLRVFVFHPGITPLRNDPEWFEITRFYPETWLNGVNTQWVYSQGVIQNPVDVRVFGPSYDLADSPVSGRLGRATDKQIFPSPHGCGSKLNQGTTGFSHCLHLPGQAILGLPDF